MLLPNRRRLPPLKRNTNNERHIIEEEPELIKKEDKEEEEDSITLGLLKNKPEPKQTLAMMDDGNYLPQFLTNNNTNKQYIENYMNMRRRNNADGSIRLNVESDDIQNENIELYTNKGLNVDIKHYETSSIIPASKHFYVESITNNKFLKFTPKDSNITGIKQFFQKKQGKKVSNNNYVNFIKETEEQIYAKFEASMNIQINNIVNNVTLFFLFTAGLLAGISIINIILLSSFSDFSVFLKTYALNVRETFYFVNSLTILSLVGNILRYLNFFRKCN